MIFQVHILRSRHRPGGSYDPFAAPPPPWPQAGDADPVAGHPAPRPPVPSGRCVCRPRATALPRLPRPNWSGRHRIDPSRIVCLAWFPIWKCPLFYQQKCHYGFGAGALLDQGRHEWTHRRIHCVVRPLPPVARYQTQSSRSPVATHRTPDLPSVQTQLPRRLTLAQPLVERCLDDRDTIRFFLDQSNVLLGHTPSCPPWSHSLLSFLVTLPPMSKSGHFCFGLTGAYIMLFLLWNGDILPANCCCRIGDSATVCHYSQETL